MQIDRYSGVFRGSKGGNTPAEALRGVIPPPEFQQSPQPKRMKRKKTENNEKNKQEIQSVQIFLPLQLV